MKKAIFTLLCLLPAFTCQARTIIVDANGSGEYPTIQDAIDDSNNGDTIILSPGTYSSEGNRDIDFKGLAITVRSTDPNDPNIVAATIIDCQGTFIDPHRGFYFHSGEGPNSVLQGITIRNGFAPTEWIPAFSWYMSVSPGAGILCRRADPIIQNCVITNCTTGNGCTPMDNVGFGGGIMCENAAPNISGCTITENSACYGAAIYGGGYTNSDPNKSSPTITSCLINRNHASFEGGGISRCEGPITHSKIIQNTTSLIGGGLAYCDGPITSCTISDNIAFHGGGGMWECGGIITDCTIAGNSAERGGGIYCRYAAPTIRNCDIFNNTARDGGGLWGVHGPVIDCNITNNSSGGLSYCTGPITNCYIAGNTADDTFGGGLSCCDGPITNCTIKNNVAQRGGGGLAFCDGTIKNCQIIGNSVLAEGQTILDGSFGGGLYKCDGLIIDCIISNNYAGSDGGGVSDCNSIRDCIITSNYAKLNGGGIAYCLASPVSRCQISSNQAGHKGGGLYWCDITNSTISGNSATFGGAISNCEDVNNCTIVGNFASGNGGAMYYVGPAPTPYAVVENCILQDNVATHKADQIYLAVDPDAPHPVPPWMVSAMTINYSNIQGDIESCHTEPNCMLEWGTGNIDTDPCFVSPGCWADANDPNIIVEPNDPNAIWIEGDYHLYPFSLCINAGDPNYLPEPNETDLDGSPRIIAGRIDMGAYESNHIDARLWILPRTINRHSRQRRIMAWLRLPQGIAKNDIDSNEPLLLYPGEIEPTRQYIFPRGRRGPKRVSIIAYFDKRDLMDVISNNGRVELKLIGRLKTGQYFYGTDTVRIINRRPPPRRPLHSR